MLTFPKALAGVFFAALAFFASGLVVNYLPEGTQLGLYYYINAAIGFLMGWRFLGKRAYEPLAQVIGFGLTTCVLIVFWALFIFAGYEMYRRSIRMRYDGPVEALVGWVEHMLEYGHLMAKPDVLMTLFLGGIAGGWLVWYFAKRTS